MSTKIFPFSDVHIDAGGTLSKLEIPGDADVIVCAGDLDVMHKSVEHLIDLQIKIKRPIVFVPGNHEHYGSDLAHPVDPALIKEALRYNVYLLDNSCSAINEIEFVGSTLWSDFTSENDRLERYYAMGLASKTMSDFKRIEFECKQLSTKNIVDKHRECSNFLRSALSKDNSMKKVVVTHWPPSSVFSDKFYNQKLKSWFSSECDDLFVLKPEAWIFGHNHTPTDTTHEYIRFVSNPVGFEHENIKPMNNAVGV